MFAVAVGCRHCIPMLATVGNLLAVPALTGIEQVDDRVLVVMRSNLCTFHRGCYTFLCILVVGLYTETL